MNRLFRCARVAPAAWNVAKTLLQTAIFWSVFLLVLPVVIRGMEARAGIRPFAFPLQRETAWALFLAAGAIGLASGVTMARAGRGTPLPIDCPRTLVVSGPYRYLRNPMAVTGLAQGLAVGIGLGSWSVIAYVVAGGLVWNTFVRPLEEEDLRRRFGGEFERYARAVRCWVPRRSGYRAAEDRVTRQPMDQ